jgi:methylated-DNA-protein-cysteine methyltransferase related protein
MANGFALNPFTTKVIEVIRKIPKGKVATYKQIAALSGKEHASRAVAWILNSCSEKYKLPWQRVVSSQGKIAFKPQTRHFLLQKRLLGKEGVDVSRLGVIDMTRFQYRKKARKPRNRPRMFGG